MHIILTVPIFIFLAVLAVVSFFFSAAEASLISSSKIKMRNLVEKGVRPAKIVMRLLTRLDKVVSAILIGNNFVNTAISSLITVIVVSFLGEKTGIILATVIAAVFLLVFCEILPKTLGIRYSENTVLFTAPFLEILVVFLQPVISVFSFVTNGIFRLFGLPIEKRSPLITEEELRLMIEVGKEEGVLSDEERKMFHRIFEFGETRVTEVMVPKEKITAVDKSCPADKLLDILVEEGHARIPVYDGKIEKVIGIIYARDLLYIWRNKGLVVLADIIHPVHYVTAGKRVNELLRDFQLKAIQLAIVVDDDKNTLGVVTLEDLLEEIVGEIEEEKV